MAAPPVLLPPPPPDRSRGVRLTVYALTLVFAVVGVLVAGPAGVGFAAFVAAYGYLLHRARRMEVGTALATAALDRAARGRFAEARALLAGISTDVLSTHIGMMVDSQRAALALYEGDLETAVAEATKGAREGKRLGPTKRIHQGSALSLRAVALAGLGRKEQALADIASVRSATYRQGSFVARAALAEAMLHARDRDHDALARVLQEERPLLFGSTSPRERLVARALARMVASRKVSVYREPARREEQELDENASWVARLAPEAAAYAKAPKLGAQLEAPAAVDASVVVGAEKRAPKARRPRARVLGLWAIFAGMFLAIWQLLTPAFPAARTVRTASASGAADSAYGSLVVLCALFIVVFTGLLAFRIARAKKLLVELSSSMELRQRGRHAEAAEAFVRLARSKVTLVAPQAERELATIAIAAGAFGKARKHAEAGIRATRSSPESLVLARAVLLPQLHGVPAFALAASGRAQLAEQELAELPKLFPAYPYLARDTFAAQLASLAAQGQLDAAAAMARDRPADLPLSMPEELLCDVLRLRAGDVLPEGERERIELELADENGAARCVDLLAPKLRVRVRAEETNDAPAEQHEEHEEEDDAPPLAMRRTSPS